MYFNIILLYLGPLLVSFFLAFHSFIHLFLLVKIPIQGHMIQDKDNSRITIIQEARIQQNETDVDIYYVTLAYIYIYIYTSGTRPHIAVALSGD
jgi:hypothetical protein